MLSKTTKNCWNGSKYSSLIARPSFNAESMTFLMQRLAMFKRFNLSIFHWASRLLSGGELELNVRTKSFPKLSSSLSSSSKFADAILVFWGSPLTGYGCLSLVTRSFHNICLVSVIWAVLHDLKIISDQTLLLVTFCKRFWEPGCLCPRYFKNGSWSRWFRIFTVRFRPIRKEIVSEIRHTDSSWDTNRSFSLSRNQNYKLETVQ